MDNRTRKTIFNQTRFAPVLPDAKRGKGLTARRPNPFLPVIVDESGSMRPTYTPPAPAEPGAELELTAQDDDAFLSHLAGTLQASETEDNTPTFDTETDA